MIPIGAVAPDFVLSSQRGNPFHLADYRGKQNVMLLFLPAAFTPICTTELPALNAMYTQFQQQAQTMPVAVTVDGTNANLAWARGCGVNTISVLSDFEPKGAVSKAYGAWMPADGMSARATVIIDKNGIVRYAVDAGKFGKRSIPGLLALATQINGGKPVANAGAVLPVLDLPVMYSMTTCPHCSTVKQFLASSGLSQRVVVRDVDRDQTAMQQLLGIEPDGSVPVLVMNGQMVAGDAPIITALRQAYRV